MKTFDRRDFLRSAACLGLGMAAAPLVSPFVARAATTRLTIVSNPGLENATLNFLMAERGYLKQFDVDAAIVEAPGTSGPFDTIVAGNADICMVSGSNIVLPRIAAGAKVKIVGAGMRKCALTIFAQPGSILTLADLEGKSVAVGPAKGSLHMLTAQLLRESGVDVSKVNFLDKGSNDECHDAVRRREADACCSSVSHLNDGDGLVTIHGADMWTALPRCIFQTAYASDYALRDKHPQIVAVMAAYGSLYEYLMSPGAHDAFIEARKHVQKKFDEASAQAIWQFNQTQRPYSRDLSLSNDDIDYLQQMEINTGSLNRKEAFRTVANMSAAHDAARLLTRSR